MENKTLTVAYFKRKLENLPDNYTISAYEGEGGAWVIIDDENGNEVLSFNTPSR